MTLSSLSPEKKRASQATVLHVDGSRVTVEGVNRVKRHTREQTGDKGVKVGGIITVEASLHISNVMLVDGEGQATRVGSRVGDDGRNVRVSRRSGKDI